MAYMNINYKIMVIKIRTASASAEFKTDTVNVEIFAWG